MTITGGGTEKVPTPQTADRKETSLKTEDEMANNRPTPDKGTPDVVSFLVFNGAGQRVAYGTGPVLKGDIQIAATPN
jgi:hypothetical protein